MNTTPALRTLGNAGALALGAGALAYANRSSSNGSANALDTTPPKPVMPPVAHLPPPRGFQGFIQHRTRQDYRVAKSVVESAATATAQLMPGLRSSLNGIIDPEGGVPTPDGTEGMTEAQKDKTARQVLSNVNKTFKSATAKMNTASIRDDMTGYYQTFRLMDADGQWTVPELAPYEEVLLPKDLGPRKMKQYVDKMTEAAGKNDYLMRFMAAASQADFKDLKAKIEAEGDQVLPDFLVYSQVLDRLTQVIGDDYRVSEAVSAHFDEIQKNPDFGKDFNVFKKAKLFSVNEGVKKFNENLRTGELDPKTLVGILPMNIIEAELVDRYQAAFGPEESELGRRGNAFAGHVLATHGPMGEGPASFSADGKKVEVHNDLTKEWDDLYMTWNMAFVTITGDPRDGAKLVIPSVSDFSKEPGAYLHNRAIALQLHMNYLGMQSLEPQKAVPDWSDAEVKNLWGIVNAQSARMYEAAVKNKAA